MLWTGRNLDEVWPLFDGNDGGYIADSGAAAMGAMHGGLYLRERLGGGEQLVPVGHWVVRHADGQVSTMTPEVFAANYEPVPEPVAAAESTQHPVAILITPRLLDEMLDRWSDPCQVRVTATPGYGTGFQLEARVVQPGHESLVRAVGRPLYAEGETVADKDEKPDPKVPSQDPKPRPIPRQGTVDRQTH